MAGLGNNVRVIVRGAGSTGRALRYVRDFVGISVNEAVERLDSNDKSRGGLTGQLCTTDPYYLNGEKIDYEFERILQAGDVLSAYDP